MVSGLHTIRLAPDGAPRGCLVALPGIMESAETLRETLQHWARQGFCVIAIDPRGHGSSPRWTEYLLQHHPGDIIVSEVLATIETEKVDPRLPLVVFGHSAGGAAAAAVASSLAERVSAVILEDPFWRFPVTQLQDKAVAGAAVAWLRRMKTLSAAERLAETRARFPLWPEDELAAWFSSKDEMDESLVANGDVIPSRGWPTLLADLNAAHVPVLVITGTVCAGMSSAHRAILRQAGVDVVVVRGATHFIRRDARELFHRLTDTFLNRQIPGSSAHDASPTPHAARCAPDNLGGPSWPK